MDISTEHEDLAKLKGFYDFIDDVLAGEEHIKSLTTRYLPRTAGMRTLAAEVLANRANATNEDVASLYDDLVTRAQFPSWGEEAIVVMVGLIARVIPVVDLPTRLKYLQENCTTDGFSLNELFQRVCYHLLRYGKVSLVADIDPTNSSGYIALYDAHSEYNWRNANVNGRTDLTMDAFKERVLEDPENPFNNSTVIQRRAYVLAGGFARVYTSLENEESSTLTAEYLGMEQRPLTYLPVVRLTAVNNITEKSNPPLLPLCRAAVKSYQLSADLFSALHRSCHPQLYVTGVASSPLNNGSNPNASNLQKNKQLNYTGAGTVWTLPTGSTAGYVEPNGNGMARVSEEMGKQKSAALEAGAKVMDIGVESGDAREARQNDQYATLYSIVQNAAKGIEQVIRYIYDMTSPSENKEEETRITFEVPVDFGRHTVDGTLAAHLLTAAERGAISFDTYWTYLTTGKLPERTLLEEIRKANSESIKLKPVTGMVQATKQGEAS